MRKRTRTILTYVLCGLANFVRISIQIGGIHPERLPENGGAANTL